MLAHPKAILFDWDNTLVHTWPTIHEALNHCLREMGHPEWSMQQVMQQVKKSMRDAFPTLFGDRWEEAAHIYQAYYRQIHLRNLEPLLGASEVLDWLKNTSIYVAIVSNKRGVSLRSECDHLGWCHYFDKIVGADDAARDKPDPAPAIMALDGSGIDAAGDHVWFVGDTVIDLECANNIGALPILYGDVATQNHALDGHAFAAHFKSHQELLATLRQIPHLQG